MGQKSAVDRLPEALRNKLIDMLHNPAVTQKEIVDAINEEAGEPLLSRSSINRYAQRMKKFAEKNRQAREVADAYIEKYSKGWKFERISRTAVAIMKTAMYEILYMPDIPVKAAVNEAVNLAKKYEEPETVPFINGILGSFARAETVQG